MAWSTATQPTLVSLLDLAWLPKLLKVWAVSWTLWLPSCNERPFHLMDTLSCLQDFMAKFDLAKSKFPKLTTWHVHLCSLLIPCTLKQCTGQRTNNLVASIGTFHVCHIISHVKLLQNFWLASIRWREPNTTSFDIDFSSFVIDIVPDEELVRLMVVKLLILLVVAVERVMVRVIIV